MPLTQNLNPWLVCPVPQPQARMRLICFPYAGASAQIFRSWSQLLPDWIEGHAIELPGRGRRWSEPAYTNLQELVQAIAPAIQPYLDKPFAFFGHSMGAWISFELARLLHQTYSLTPEWLFISARRAPQLPTSKPPLHSLPDVLLLQELHHLSGTPTEVLENQELLNLLLPILRADFTLLETYVYRNQPPLPCPIQVYGGQQDTEVTIPDLAAWQQQTSCDFNLKLLPGGHFFLHSAQTELVYSLSLNLQGQCYCQTGQVIGALHPDPAMQLLNHFFN